MKPLQDITIIDLTRILSGPYCTMYFADLGANVIKIEPPTGDDTRTWGPPFIESESAYFLSVNRNKKSMVLNLKLEEDKNILRKLIQSADVVVENFRPGTMEKLGFGFDQLKTLNPSIIFASISGFGQTGRYRNEPGYDLIAQGMGGFMSVTGEINGPPLKGGYSLADIGAGMWAIIGILTAIHRRQTNPEAQWIDASLLETIISWQTYLAGNYFATGEDPQPLGSAHPNICPYQAFSAKDGHFNLAIGNDKIWLRACEAMEEPTLATDERFKTNPERVVHRNELVSIMEKKFKNNTVSFWVELFRKYGIPVGPINQLSQILNDPYVKERELVKEISHSLCGNIQMISSPLHFTFGENESFNQIMYAPPQLGEHNEFILKQILENK
ncbi:MAG: CoA transferase [Acidibacillus sp.]|nr:CoA transferase [Acidibacillus sp.]